MLMQDQRQHPAAASSCFHAGVLSGNTQQLKWMGCPAAAPSNSILAGGLVR
jgi:hypothetical protein